MTACDDKPVSISSLQGQKGFTLVELAIVMVIIGLLIGGVLKGMEIRENAQITATIVQSKSYEAATILFFDTYNALPGDMVNASNTLPECTTNCDPYRPRAGNMRIGNPAWAASWYNQAGYSVSLPATDEEAEAALYWAHLVKANLVTGVTDQVLNGSETAWGVTNPAGKIGGGFVIGFADGSPTPGQPFYGTAGN